MRKSFPGNLTLISAGLILFMISCTPESCFEETNAFLKASLYLNKSGNLLAPDSLTVFGINMETNKLYTKAANIKLAQLPLNASATRCVYILRINGITDTLEICYNSFPHLISKECGYVYYYNIYPDSIYYTTNSIDSIFIKKSSITTLNEENIRIFY